MKLRITWNKYTWKWELADEEGFTFLPDSPNCRNLHRIFANLNYEEPNYYETTNVKINK